MLPKMGLHTISVRFYCYLTGLTCVTVRNVQVSERGCAEFTCRQFWWSFDFYKVF